MSKPNNTYPNWFLWLWENALRLGIVAGVASLVAISAIGYLLELRLESIEERLGKAPPKSYRAPEIKKLRVADPESLTPVREQLVYVPVYSHVYFAKGRPFLLETTLSLRNTDPERTLYLRSVRYHDTDGALVRTPIEQTIALAPLQTIELLVPQRDSTGGSGANFLVEWMATEPISEPMIEALMVGNVGTHGISFRARGVNLDR